MKILVTGGSGFLGSHVADELTNNGHKVIIYDLLKSKWLKKNQKFIKGNITDTKKLSRLISETDIVYNFAALGDLDKARFMPIETVNYNILSLVNMLKLSKKFTPYVSDWQGAEATFWIMRGTAIITLGW